MAELKVAPFAGIDHVTGEPNKPEWLKDALNVVIDREGGLARRRGTTALLAGVSSVFGSRVLDSLVGVLGGNLVSISTAPVATSVLGPVVDEELWYEELNNELVFAGMNTLGVVRDGAVVDLGIDVPAAPGVSAGAGGGLAAGTYGVCVTFVASTGEESGASTAKFVEVSDNGSLDVNVPTSLQSGVTRCRVYATTCNGDVFYLMSEATGATSIGAGDKPGRACDTRNKVRMRPGAYLKQWRGRILVARGNVLLMSEPFRYGLHDPRSGYVQFPQRITFIQPVEGGVFVGQPGGVLFLAGDDITKAELRNTGASPPVSGSAILVDGADFKLDDLSPTQKYAVWFSERGFAIGAPNGGVTEPQSTRVRVPAGQYGATVVLDRRVLALVS
jgi:hypothetical protein